MSNADLKALAVSRVGYPLNTWPDHIGRHSRTLLGFHLFDDTCLRCWLERVATERCYIASETKIGLKIEFHVTKEYTYTNWQGETRQRRLIPKHLWFGKTEWHPEPQWLVSCYDFDSGKEKDFALSGFHGDLKGNDVRDSNLS